MKIHPALKGRNKILDHKPVLPLQGIAILNTGSNSQGRPRKRGSPRLGWHVAAPSGRDSKSATSKNQRQAAQLSVSGEDTKPEHVAGRTRHVLKDLPRGALFDRGETHDDIRHAKNKVPDLSLEREQ
jgi:hypothetical protein